MLLRGTRKAASLLDPCFLVFYCLILAKKQRIKKKKQLNPKQSFVSKDLTVTKDLTVKLPPTAVHVVATLLVL